MDATIHNTVCKHEHLVHMFLKVNDVGRSKDSEIGAVAIQSADVQPQVIESAESTIEFPPHDAPMSHLTTARESAMDTLYKLQVIPSCNSFEALNSIKKTPPVSWFCFRGK